MTPVIVALVVVVMLYMLYDIRSAVRQEGARRRESTTTVLDTSALIDGRIADLAEAGFMSGKVIIPKAVLNELQLLADGRDTRKRTRARAGLEVAEKLQQYTHVRVSIDEKYANTKMPTDEVLLKLAKHRRARLCTTDYNLQKVAAAESVAVCNVNELAQLLRPQVLPGEKITVEIVQKGESKGQGVGYLPDGTMVVVENAHTCVGSDVRAKVEKIIQTKAGKMVFASSKKSR